MRLFYDFVIGIVCVHEQIAHRRETVNMERKGMFWSSICLYFVWAPEAPFFYILHLQSVSEILCGFMVGIMCVDKQEGYGQTTVNMERKVAGNRAARRESGCGWKGMLCPFLCLYFVLCFVSFACDLMPCFFALACVLALYFMGQFLAYLC